MKLVKIIVEKHADGYVAYPLGLKGVVVGEGDTYEEALADVKSAIQFHLETFGPDVFDTDAPKGKVIKTFELLGFSLVREREHIAMIRENPDGTKTPLTLPNHSKIKGSTLRTICTQAGIPREEFLKAYQNV